MSLSDSNTDSLKQDQFLVRNLLFNISWDRTPCSVV